MNIKIETGWFGKKNGFVSKKKAVNYLNGNFVGTYTGNIMNGIPLGKCHLLFYTGDIYEGNWLNGMNGKDGKITFPNGDSIEGEFKDDKIVGKGIYRSASGWTWEGKFENGNPSGVGVKKDSKGVILGKFEIENGKILEVK